MKVKKPVAAKTLGYLASPYKKFPKGAEQAFIDVCAIAGHLIQSGMAVYSPIAHNHPIAIHAGMKLHDYEIWIPLDKMMLDRCDVLIVAHMPSWEISEGIKIEIDYFIETGKSIYDLNIKNFCMVRRKNPKDAVDFNQMDMGKW